MRMFKKPKVRNSVWSQLKGVYDGATILSKTGTAVGVLLLLSYCASNDTFPRGVGIGDVLSFILISACFGLICGIFGGLIIHSGAILVGGILNISAIQKKWPKHLKIPKAVDWWVALPMFIFSLLFELLFISLSVSTWYYAIFSLIGIQFIAIALYLICSLPFSGMTSASNIDTFGLDKSIFNSMLLVFMFLVALNISTTLKNTVLNMTMRLANVRQDVGTIEIYLDSRVAKDLQLDTLDQDLNLAIKNKSMVKISGIVLFGKIGSYTTIQATQLPKEYQIPISEVDLESLALAKTDPTPLKKILVKKTYVDKSASGVTYFKPTDKVLMDKGLVEIGNISLVQTSNDLLLIRDEPNKIVVEIPNEKIIVTKKVQPQS